MRARGFTLIELLVVISIVALLLGVALDRLLKYQEMGERAAVQENIAAINVALTMKFAAYVAAGRPQAIAAEVGKNPVTVLARPPLNYLGELYAPDVKDLPRMAWYFDRQSGHLVYLPNRRRHLASESGPPEMLRFRIRLTDVDGETHEIREVPQPFIDADPPFRWEIG